MKSTAFAFAVMLLPAVATLPVMAARASNEVAAGRDPQSLPGTRIAAAQGESIDFFTAQIMKGYRSAADRGDADAQFNLGLKYAKGRGVSQDYVQAHMWLSLAAANFAASETEQRDRALAELAEFTGKMTPAQIAEAQKLAREWKPKPGS